MLSVDPLLSYLGISHIFLQQNVQLMLIAGENGAHATIDRLPGCLKSIGKQE